MNERRRYGTLHWARVTLWPLSVLTMARTARAAMNALRR
jgi:hypothetical protein